MRAGACPVMKEFLQNTLESSILDGFLAQFILIFQCSTNHDVKTDFIIIHK